LKLVIYSINYFLISFTNVHHLENLNDFKSLKVKVNVSLKIQNFFSKKFCIKFHLIFSIFADIDECAIGISKCTVNSVCINTPGWYQCDCIEGYHSTWPDNNYGSLCMG
jgi:hypothetical protein